jgi:hypothetical protein
MDLIRMLRNVAIALAALVGFAAVPGVQARASAADAFSVRPASSCSGFGYMCNCNVVQNCCVSASGCSCTYGSCPPPPPE